MSLEGEFSGAVKPVDLEIRVTAPWGRGERAFEFELDSPSGVVPMHHKRIRGPAIHTPEAFRKELMEQVACLGRGQDADGRKLREEDRLPEMVAIGHDLYRKLFPRELREILTGVRDRVSTLLITADEPWIPWEVLHPDDDGDDDFLCMRFQLSRWLTGDASLLHRKHVGNVLALQAGSKAKLASAAYEIELLESLCQAAGARGVFLPSVTVPELSNRLEEESFDLIHFAGHGRGQASARFGSARIDLGDRSFRPRNITPAAKQQLQASRPLVFFNSCQVSQLGQDLTELGGWAPHWVRRCGASAFLGPSWAVDDTRALLFAETFYDELRAGRPLGEAARISRMVLRDLAPGELTWLAYCLYGHPGAQVTLGPPRPNEQPATATTSPKAGPPSVTTIRPSRIAPRHRDRTPRSRARSMMLRSTTLIASVVLLVALVALWLRSGTERTESTPPHQTVNEGGAGLPASVEHDETERGPDPETTAQQDPPTDPQERQRARPASPVPLLPVEAGKVAIIAVDPATDNPARDIARAIRSLLAQHVTSIRPSLPQVPASLLGLLESRDPSVLPADGRAPWGAELLLFARASWKDIPQRVPHLQGGALTLETEIRSTQSDEVRATGPQTETGAGVSRDQAVLQAAERCLRETVSILNQGAQP